jgi:hypothetical protein
MRAVSNADTYKEIGRMSMPVNFRHADVFRRGRPRHGKPGILSTYDAFYIQHPPMDTGRRAKIFSAFDALSGFDSRIAAKEVLYEDPHSLTEEAREELDRRLAAIRRLVPDSRTARQNRVTAKVTYFTPCADPESEYSGTGRGQYRTVTGLVRKIDPVSRTILIGDENISLDTIIRIG